AGRTAARERPRVSRGPPRRPVLHSHEQGREELPPGHGPRRHAARLEELVPHRPDVLLEGVDLFRDHCVLAERENALPHLAVIYRRTKARHRLDFPEPVYTVFRDMNPEFNTTQVRFRYQSLVTPESVYDYDLDTHQRKLLKRTEVLGGYDPSRYAT